MRRALVAAVLLRLRRRAALFRGQAGNRSGASANPTIECHILPPLLMLSRASSSAIAIVLALTVASSAFAQTGAGAAAAKARGDAAMDSARPADALRAYNEAYALDPQPALLYNRGRAHMALEQFPEALKQLLQFRAEAPPDLRAKVPGLEGTIESVRKRIARVRIACSVAGAEVRVRGVVVGKTPLREPVEVNAGATELEVIADGYFIYRSTPVLPGEVVTDVQVTLSPRSVTGLLRIQSTPAGASVKMDGGAVGVTPAEITLNPGTHELRLSLSGYSDVEEPIVVRANENRDVAFALELSKPFYAKWWFWTAVGGTLAAGAVVGIVVAATTERGPVPGTLNPGVLVGSHGFRF